MKNPFLFSAVLLLLVACGAPEQGTQDIETPPDTTSIETVEWVGSYADTLPCADCPGILTQLELAKDSTFILRERYLERDSIPYGHIGKWSVSGGQLMLGRGDEGPVLWDPVPGGLERMGRDGKPSESSLSNVIHRVDHIAPSSMRITGAYIYYADSHSFKPCGNAYSFPVAMDAPDVKSAGLELERLYMKQVKHAPEPLYVELVVEMRTGPAMEGDGTEEYLHLDQMVRVLEVQDCP